MLSVLLAYRSSGRFGQAHHPPRYAALLTPSSPKSRYSSPPEGSHDYDPLRPDRFERLMGLRTTDGQPLPKSLMAEIGREIRRLELVLEQLAEVEAEGG